MFQAYLTKDIYVNNKLILPAILTYALVIAYAIWSNSKNKVEVIKQVQDRYNQIINSDEIDKILDEGKDFTRKISIIFFN